MQQAAAGHGNAILTAPAAYCAVDQRYIRLSTCILQEKPCRYAVQSVYYDIVARDGIRGVFWGYVFPYSHEFYGGIYERSPLFRGFRLAFADSSLRGKKLPVQVAYIKAVAVNGGNVPDAEPKKVFGYIPAEAAAARHKYPLFMQQLLLLPG